VVRDVSYNNISFIKCIIFVHLLLSDNLFRNSTTVSISELSEHTWGRRALRLLQWVSRLLAWEEHCYSQYGNNNWVHALIHRLNAGGRIPIFLSQRSKRAGPWPSYVHCWAWHVVTDFFFLFLLTMYMTRLCFFTDTLRAFGTMECPSPVAASGLTKSCPCISFQSSILSFSHLSIFPRSRPSA
jgi:hypothetical protein